MQMTTDERRSRLIEWLEVIRKDLQDLLLDQFIFREFQKIVERNPKFAGSPGLFTQWIASGFAQATAVGIRRHAKESKSSISLARFLTEVKNNPDLITRQFYIGLYHAACAPIHIGQNDFDDIAGAGNDRLPTSLIERQIDELERSVYAVETYVDCSTSITFPSTTIRIPVPLNQIKRLSSCCFLEKPIILAERNAPSVTKASGCS